MPWEFIIKELHAHPNQQKHGFSAKGELVSPGGMRWDAISGPFQKGHLPVTTYKISDCRLREKTSMTDDAGNAWSCNIDQSTDPSRTLLRIHPDGNNEGTLGCIGISEKDTTSVYNALKNSNDTTLIVRFARDGNWLVA